MPVTIIFYRPLSPGDKPAAVEAALRQIEATVFECLSDGRVEIWDYTGDTPSFSGDRAWWDTGMHQGSYRLEDESDAAEGGAIRHSLTVFVNYTDKSF